MAAKVGNNELVEEVEDRHYWILRVYVLFFDGEYLYARLTHYIHCFLSCPHPFFVKPTALSALLCLHDLVSVKAAKTVKYGSSVEGISTVEPDQVSL